MELSGGGTTPPVSRRRGIGLMPKSESRLADIVARHERELVPEWLRYQLEAVTRRRDLLNDDELRDQSRQFVERLRAGLEATDGNLDVMSPAWAGVRELLDELSRARARQ